MTVRASHAWPTNGHLIADVARLGYLRADDLVLDMTYGKGVWWQEWRPDALFTLPAGVDFRATGYPPDTFDVVALDPPYKLNGRPDPAVDARYGVHVPATRSERHALMANGLLEAATVTVPRGVVLFKCQDQVNGGQIRWQTRMFTELGEAYGLELVDRFDLTGQHRPQPMEGRRQQHAHGRPSTLLVFRKERA